jgi:ribosomal protein S26
MTSRSLIPEFETPPQILHRDLSKAFVDAHNLVTKVYPGANYCSNGSVHSRCIAAAGQNRKSRFIH